MHVHYVVSELLSYRELEFLTNSRGISGSTIRRDIFSSIAYILRVRMPKTLYLTVIDFTKSVTTCIDVISIISVRAQIAVIRTLGPHAKLSSVPRSMI